MAGHFTIELRQLRFFADHGMYAEEMKTGNEFEVDISVGCRSPKKRITSMEQTVNYVEIYRIAQEEFSRRRQLLETLAMDIAERIKTRFDEVESVRITIRKLNPPITNFSGSVAVSYSREFK